MKKQSISLLALIAFGLLVWTGCNRGDKIGDNELQTSIDNNFASSEFSNIENMINIEARNDSDVYKTGGVERDGIYCECAEITVTVDIPTETAHMEIDFGTGCLCSDARLRQGKLIADFEGRWRDEGSKATVVPENYKVNGYAIDFLKTYTNDGRDPNTNNLTYTVQVTDASITAPDNSGTFYWESTRHNEWSAGEATFWTVLDDEWKITGSASGTSRTDVDYTANIDEPLHIKYCSNKARFEIVDGTFTLTPTGGKDRVVDYGDGECDGEAVVTVGAYTATINF